METYIQDNVNDITYRSELIPPSCFRKKAGGINLRKITYSHSRVRKLCAHL